MSRFQAVPYEDKTEIDLSPMLDVIFIMLIFFIITASFINEDGLPVTLPSGIQTIESDVETVRVVVKANGVFTVNNRSMSAAGVRSYVVALSAENPTASFVVELAKGSIIRDAAVAIEAGRSIGHDVVTIMRDE
jgi:biopolymer transport protein ExbD